MSIEITPGVYETGGEIYVVKLNREKTRLYAKRLVAVGGQRLTVPGQVVNFDFEYAPGAMKVVRSEHRMSYERAKALAVQYGRCINCGRFLKDAKSVELGIGPVCRKAFGPMTIAPTVTPELLEALPKPFPIRSYWSYASGHYVSEASTLQGSQRTDPFGGSLTRYKFQLVRDQENELAYWVGQATIDSREIVLHVIND